MTTETARNSFARVGWFDDLGTGNEQYRFLSNFYEGEPIMIPWVEWTGAWRSIAAEEDPSVRFRTGEHAFQALKCRTIGAGDEFGEIVMAPTPGDAKRLGRRVYLRPDWERVKYDVMAAVVRSKFTIGRAEGRLLLNTGHALLTEGTYWHDTVWGVDLNANEWGRNWLGTLLMARRAELRAKARFNIEHDTVAANSAFAIQG